MMPEGEHKEECIDDITNMVMDEAPESGRHDPRVHSLGDQIRP